MLVRPRPAVFGFAVLVRLGSFLAATMFDPAICKTVGDGALGADVAPSVNRLRVRQFRVVQVAVLAMRHAVSRHYIGVEEAAAFGVARGRATVRVEGAMGEDMGANQVARRRAPRRDEDCAVSKQVGLLESVCRHDGLVGVSVDAGDDWCWGGSRRRGRVCQQGSGPKGTPDHGGMLAAVVRVFLLVVDLEGIAGFDIVADLGTELAVVRVDLGVA